MIVPSGERSGKQDMRIELEALEVDTIRQEPPCEGPKSFSTSPAFIFDNRWSDMSGEGGKGQLTWTIGGAASGIDEANSPNA